MARSGDVGGRGRDTAGRTPPRIGDPITFSDNDVPARLAAIESRLRDMAEQLDHIGAGLSAILRSADRRDG